MSHYLVLSYKMNLDLAKEKSSAPAEARMRFLACMMGGVPGGWTHSFATCRS